MWQDAAFDEWQSRVQREGHYWLDLDRRQPPTAGSASRCVGPPVAHLVFHTLTEAKAAYPQQGGKYTGPVGPEFSKLSLDGDWDIIRSISPEVEA